MTAFTQTFNDPMGITDTGNTRANIGALVEAMDITDTGTAPGLWGSVTDLVNEDENFDVHLTTSGSGVDYLRTFSEQMDITDTGTAPGYAGTVTDLVGITGNNVFDFQQGIGLPVLVFNDTMGIADAGLDSTYLFDFNDDTGLLDQPDIRKNGATSKAGSSTGTWSWTGTAVGTSALTSAKGTAAGLRAWVGVAIGQTPHRGSGSGTVTYLNIAAVGTRPAISPGRGTATGLVTFVGTAAGKKQPKAVDSGLWAWVGTNSAKTRRLGSSTGLTTYVGTAHGLHQLFANNTGTGQHQYLGKATGAQGVNATTPSHRVLKIVQDDPNAKEIAAPTPTRIDSFSPPRI